MPRLEVCETGRKLPTFQYAFSLSTALVAEMVVSEL
jgi:hypothetical protein